MAASRHQSPAGPSQESSLFSDAMERFLERLPERSRAILAARFGIHDGQPKTLEEIGSLYAITRERVRQVICSALEQLKKALASDSALAVVVRKVEETLQSRHGIMVADDLLEELSHGKKKERGAINAFLEALPGVRSEKPSRHHERIFFLQDFSLAEWQSIKEKAKAILDDTKDTLEGKALYRRFQEKAGPGLGEDQFFHMLAAAKDIKQNVFGKWGLATWSDIKPRGTRERAYLILKTAAKPLHFRDIAELIDKHGLHGKKQQSHPQTVHNELIKDKRFVLVGRGIYALSEWGYKKGTVKEVVEEILKTAKKPLTRDQILEEVFKVRQVKKSTIIINLNTFFQRVSKNTYTLKK